MTLHEHGAKKIERNLTLSALVMNVLATFLPFFWEKTLMQDDII